MCAQASVAGDQSHPPPQTPDGVCSAPGPGCLSSECEQVPEARQHPNNGVSKGAPSPGAVSPLSKPAPLLFPGLEFVTEIISGRSSGANVLVSETRGRGADPTMPRTRGGGRVGTQASLGLTLWWHHLHARTHPGHESGCLAPGAPQTAFDKTDPTKHPVTRGVPSQAGADPTSHCKRERDR